MSALLLFAMLPSALSLLVASGRACSPRMTTAVIEVPTLPVEECVRIFGRLADSQHMFTEPIRTAASGFEFSSNTAIKPKWLVGYVSRECCGDDVDLPPHRTKWSSLLFADGTTKVCDRKHFDSVLCGAEYVAPLGTPKWSVPGKALVDTKACAAEPSSAALDALWLALGGDGDELSSDVVITRLREMATSDPLDEAVLFSEFAIAMQAAANA